MTRPAFTERPQRLRASPALRELWRERHLRPGNLIAPFFVTDEWNLTGPLEGLPGIRRHHVDDAAGAAHDIAAAGVRGIIVFGVPGAKDDVGSGAWDENGVVARSIRAIRGTGIDLVLAADVCLCQYTTHGHCGVMIDDHIAGDATTAALARTSVAYARAGATLVAPSGMIDGSVGAIRRALDDEGFIDVGILAYTVKHASALYGPFRDAARSAPSSGDRRSHQLDPSNAREAARVASAHVAEGADVLMVKPALTNLDTLARLRLRYPDIPLAAFAVSGEYAMVHAAAGRGWLNERETVLELLTAIQRAGADVIITYHAVAAAQWIREGAPV